MKQKEKTASKNTKRTGRLIVILLVLLLLGTVFFFAWQYFSREGGVYKDRDAQLGILPNMSEEGSSAEAEHSGFGRNDEREHQSPPCI